MIDTLTIIYSAFSFMTGAVIASFLNVVIWRVPRGESIVRPASHCPKCNAAIRWYQNIPIVSWLALRGRCANCKAPISPRYILIEALGGGLFLAAYLRFEMMAPVTWVWIALMIVGTFIDFDHKLLPDFVTVGGMIYGLLLGGLSWVYTGSFRGFIVSVSGLACGFGLLGLVRYVGSLVFKREAMGLGDVFLMGAVGAISGPRAVLFVLIFSSIFGSIVGVTMVALAKTRFGRFLEIPYGPYICAAHLLYIFYGPQMIDWYVQLMKFEC